MCNLINIHTCDEENGKGNGDRIGEGGSEAKKRKKPQNG